ncbi:MAG: hypothetical protein D3921_07880 [Candidatus Electrothrix sp. AW1]|nr:hypothetical protein [Candidatus Electrothrix sp. AX1]MCI5182420.1 hypothetical protein [Candidatus Electrothrix gigas]
MTNRFDNTSEGDQNVGQGEGAIGKQENATQEVCGDNNIISDTGNVTVNQGVQLRLRTVVLGLVLLAAIIWAAFNHEEYRDNSRKIEIKSGRDTNYIENLQPPPSFREVTVARGENGNPIGIADNPSPIQNAVGLLAKVMRGEEVNLQEASPSKFLINSGTEIAILDSDNSSEQPSTGFTDPIGFTQFVNIKILEGPYKNRTGWIHASTIHHEQRKK